MKKQTVIIVNNNMNIGGVQKSLVNFVKELNKKYDCTLLLFSKQGSYLHELPRSVYVVEVCSLYKMLGVSYDESKSKLSLYFLRQLIAIIFKFLGRSIGMKLVNLSQKKLKKKYDIAISYFQNAGNNLLYGGCNDFVLSKISAIQKVTFLHCDYRECGSHNEYNDRQYYQFDKIAACSEGCRNAFLEVLPNLVFNTYTVRNCHDYDNIRDLAKEFQKYNHDIINVVTVARMSREKGIDRALLAFKYAKDNGIIANYHLVGDGPDIEALKQQAKLLDIIPNIFFYGNQSNPYRYMKDADLMLIPSYHEAAPLVIDEARCLGIPILSTATTSTIDMIVNTQCGWMCDNNQTSLNETLFKLLSEKNTLAFYKKQLNSAEFNNSEAIDDFQKLLS